MEAAGEARRTGAVTPAKAGIHGPDSSASKGWIPAFAGMTAGLMQSEQPGDSSVFADRDVVRRRDARQAGHRHDLAADDDDELGASREAHLADRDDVVARRALGVGVGREAELRLGDAYRQMAEAVRLELGEAVAHRLVGGDVLGAI